MTDLPKNYAWLETYPMAEAFLVEEALKHYGIHEIPGTGDNPEILGWAEELGIKDYTHDAEPWCGLFMAYVAMQAGEALIAAKPLWAMSWAAFGRPSAKAAFGDVLIFKRNNPHTGKPIGGHVGLYIGEDETCYHVLGGNESDQVNITRFPKVALVTARRSPRVNEPAPANICQIKLPPSGMLSAKEA